MSIKDLKQYLEKELQAKRFLNEGLDFVKELEGIEARIEETKQKAFFETNELAKITDKKKIMEAKIKALQEEIDDKTDKVNTMIDNARERKEELIQEGKDEAQELYDKANADLDETRSKIDVLTKTYNELVVAVDELKDVKQGLLNDLDKLRKKLG